MAGPKVRLKQIIRAIGPLGYGDTASATGIRRTALAAALQYRCLAAVLQEPVCWRTRWARTESVGCRNRFASKPAPTVPRRVWVGGAGFSRESDRCHTAELSVFRAAPALVGPASAGSDRCHTAEFSVLRLASSRLKPVPLWNAVRPVGPISTWDGRRASRDAYPRRAWALSDAWQRFCRSRLAGERGGSEPRVLAAETGSPASRLLQFRVVPGSVGSASAGKLLLCF
jgi:hypothetical protein